MQGIPQTQYRSLWSCLAAVAVLTGLPFLTGPDAVSAQDVRPAAEYNWQSRSTYAVTQVAAIKDDPLQQTVQEAIEITSRRTFETEVHTPWQIAHGVLALRHDYYLKDADGKPVKALDWIAGGPDFRGKPWFVTTPYGGKGHPFTEPWHFEGHPNQFLALFTLARLPRDFEFAAGLPDDVDPNFGRKKFTVDDWIRTAKMECNDEEEMTWTLWALAFYEDAQAEWNNKDGDPWSMERLIRKQMKSPVNKSACGGNHGLFAIACARNSYLQSGQQLRGVYLEAHMHLQTYIELARKMQNKDGSFSSQWYKGPEHSDNINRRLSTTGHCLEFLLVALPQSEIEQPWIRHAVTRISRDLIDSAADPLEPGGMYHALDALMIYRERMGWPTAKPKPVDIAQEPADTVIR